MSDCPANNRPWIIRSGALGDMIMMTALCAALAEKHGAQAHIIGTGHWTEPIFGRCPAIDQIFAIDSMKTPWLLNTQKRAAATAMKSSQPAAVYVCGGDEASRKLADRSGLPVDRIHWIKDFQALPDEHVIDHMLRFVGSGPRNTDIVLRDEDRADATAWLAANIPDGRPPILVQPGNKKTMRSGARTRASNTKYWPEERWQKLLRHVYDENPQRVFIICGTEEERSLAEDISSTLPADAVHLAAGDLPIPRLMALAEHAEAMISVDTGPAHAVAAIGCPMIVLFGSTDPLVYLPRNSKTCLPVCALSERESGSDWWREHHRMEDITVDHALAVWSQLGTA